MSASRIEWTEVTWNPVTGCSKISAGCANCYAECMARRLQAMGQPNYARGFRVTTHEQMVDRPLTWARPSTVFVNSMGDLLHEDVPADFVARVFATMEVAHRHTFQVLTKRLRRTPGVAAGCIRATPSGSVGDATLHDIMEETGEHGPRPCCRLTWKEYCKEVQSLAP